MSKSSESLSFSLSEYKGDELMQAQTWTLWGEALHPTSESFNFSTDLLAEIREGLAKITSLLKS